MAAMLNALPLEDESPFLPTNQSFPIVFDALMEWGGTNSTHPLISPYNATLFMYQAYGNRTTTLAKLNPGYDWSGSPLSPPPLTNQPDLSLVDYLIMHQLFTLYLTNGCVPFTDENSLMEMITQSNIWPQPIAVYGYDDTHPLFGGDIFEAETLCVSQHNMGQVASSGVSNMAFYSRSPPITTPLVQSSAPKLVYNSSKIYITFLVGDGDNIAFAKGTRFTWFQERLTACAAGPNAVGCNYPLAWTMSSHLLTTAPGILQWYFSAALNTTKDYFLLPPSGHLYAYPGLMNTSMQQAFVSQTEVDAILFNTSTTVEWEFMGTWENAIQTYIPRYGNNGIIKGLFAVNVPYMIPIIEFGVNQTYIVVNSSTNKKESLSAGPTFLFRPNEWRGTTGGALLPPFMLNATAFASLINNDYPLGTITHIYLTSDGGARWSDFTDLYNLLAEYVEVVPPDTLVDLARQAS